MRETFKTASPAEACATSPRETGRVSVGVDLAAVILGTLFLISENLEGSRGSLELFSLLLIVGMQVRVGFLGLLAIRLAYLIIRSCLRHTEDLIQIALHLWDLFPCSLQLPAVS